MPRSNYGVRNAGSTPSKEAESLSPTEGGMEREVEARMMNIPKSYRAYPRYCEKKPNAVAAIALTSLVGALIFLIPPMYFSEIASDFNVSTSSLGLTTSVLLLVGTVTALITGPLADRLGNRPLLVAGSLAAGGYFLGFSLSPSPGFLILSAAVGGIAYAILPNLSAAAAAGMQSEAARTRALGWTSASAALSVVIVSPILAVFASVAGWRPAFGLAAMVSVGSGWFVYGRLHSAPSSTVERDFLGDYARLFRHRQSRMLLSSSVLRAVCWFGMLTYLGAFLGDQLNVGPLGIAVVFAAGGGAFFAGSLLTPGLMQLFPPRMIAGCAQLIIAALVAILFVAANSFAAALAVTAMLGLSGAFSFVSISVMLAEKTPVGKGTTMSLNGVLTSGAATVGGALGAAVLNAADYRVLAVVLTIPGILSALVLCWPKRMTSLSSSSIDTIENPAHALLQKTGASLTFDR